MSDLGELSREVPEGVKVYITEPASSIDELARLAEVAGVAKGGTYYGGGYEGLSDDRIVRWKRFQEAGIEVTPLQPLQGTTYLKTQGNDIATNPVVARGKVDSVFDFELYQIFEGRKGAKIVRAWTEPDEAGTYNIVDIPEGSATFRLTWVESATTKQRRALDKVRLQEEDRKARFLATVRAAVAKVVRH